MITAKEARKKSEEEIFSKKKIENILNCINDLIIEACENGESTIFLNESNFKNLSAIDTIKCMDLIASLGYKVEPQYEIYDAIQMSYKTGYKISW